MEVDDAGELWAGPQSVRRDPTSDEIEVRLGERQRSGRVSDVPVTQPSSRSFDLAGQVGEQIELLACKGMVGDVGDGEVAPDPFDLDAG